MRTVTAFIGLSILTGLVLAQTSTSAFQEGLRAIEPSDVYATCGELASPRFHGRLTGDQGYRAMSQWVAGLFASWGLKPFAAGNGYLQEFKTQHTIIDQAGMTLLLPAESGGNQAEKRLEPFTDFLPLLYSDSGEKTGPVVFAGWGISAPELGYDDYAGLDLQNKFVLCFRGTPDPADARFTEHDEHRTRMVTALRKGAAGLLYIYDEPLANPNGDWLAGFMPAIVSTPVADLMLESKGLDSKKLREDLLRYKKPLSFPLNTTVTLKVVSRHFPDSKGYNICGMLEGTDPQLRKEIIVVGAHADHCGEHMGAIFPGANDNASGAAVVIEMARAFSGLSVRPRRSLVFVLFGGEETGLQGSHYFADHLNVLPGSVVGMLNFDMAGAGDGAGCGYSATPDYLQSIIQAADKEVGILRGSRPIRRVGVRSSDFAPFFVKGIPCLSISSNGPHLAYHQRGDTIFRVNPHMLAATARLGFAAAYLLADRPAQPTTD
ncbi:MAG: M28 family peptidase [Acidobacteria bacterium]|nr:MAG: M28 family peptidase [Acidobacteriota bacterium]